jgi:hypothetical protein
MACCDASTRRERCRLKQRSWRARRLWMLPCWLMRGELCALEKKKGRCKTQLEAPHSQTRRHKDGMKALGGSERDCATTASEWQRSAEAVAVAVAIRAEVGMSVSFFLFLSPGMGWDFQRCLGAAMDGKTESADSRCSLARRRDVSSRISARYTQRSTEL